LREGACQTIRIANIGDERNHRHIRIDLPNFHLRLEHAVLAVTEQHQSRASSLRHLTAQFGADGTAGPCDEHGFPPEVLSALGAAHDLAATQQVHDIDVAEAADAD